MDSKGIILAAHRGDKKRYPENTMPAFIAAEKFGCDMIEMDLHMTADGELVIMHDRSAKRTAGVDRNLDEMTLAEVKELDAEVDGEDRHSGEMRGDKRDGDSYAPGESAVEDEGEQRLSARTECEIHSVREGEDRHRAGNDEEH